jgi:ABC-type multidrug transport system ATPase subunit
VQACSSSQNDAVILSLQGVSKFYGRRQIIDIPSLEFVRGERGIIFGANASGKSTLMRIMAGISRLTSGSIVWNKPYASPVIGFVPQHGGLNPELSVAENFAAMSRLYGRNPDQDYKSSPIVTCFGLEKFLQQTVGTLSGGYQRLACFAAVLNVEPSVLFIDEPLSGLDKHHIQGMFTLLEEVSDRLDLLLVTSHEAGDVKLCNREVRLDGGKLV